MISDPECAFVPLGRLALHSHWAPEPANVQVTWSFGCVSRWIWSAGPAVLIGPNGEGTALRRVCAGRWSRAVLWICRVVTCDGVSDCLRRSGVEGCGGASDWGDSVGAFGGCCGISRSVFCGC